MGDFPGSSLAGAQMLYAVRHKLWMISRLAAFLVLLGIGTVPVECSAVYGPHSIFISAEAVAQVRSGEHHHAEGHALSAPGMAGMSMPAGQMVAYEPATSTTPSATPGTISRPPVPASTSVDALIAVAIFEANGDPGPSDFAVVSRLRPLPADHILPGPEPPPPQRGS